MRGAALAMLPMLLLLAGCFGGDEETALLTVVPQAGPAATDGGWSMPVQLTATRDGRRVLDSGLGRLTDYRVAPGRYVFTLYGKVCPTQVNVGRDDHVVIAVTLYEQGRCLMTVSRSVGGAA